MIGERYQRPFPLSRENAVKPFRDGHFGPLDDDSCCNQKAFAQACAV